MKAVVLSPHLDDAVLSVGATINSLRRRGARVVLLTAFAGDPDRDVRLSYWDAKRNARDKAHALEMRCQEDDAATAMLQIESIKLPFDDFAYLPPRDPAEIVAAMEPELADADVILTPGWPLIHPDHRYLSILIQRCVRGAALYFYEELPYGAQPVQVLKRNLRGRRAPSLAYEIGSDLTWRRALTSSEDFAAKRAAVACYAGELAALGRHATFGKLHDQIWRREMIGVADGAPINQFLFGGPRP